MDRPRADPVAARRVPGGHVLLAGDFGAGEGLDEEELARARLGEAAGDLADDAVVLPQQEAAVLAALPLGHVAGLLLHLGDGGDAAFQVLPLDARAELAFQAQAAGAEDLLDLSGAAG